jgi:hypothetical protein
MLGLEPAVLTGAGAFVLLVAAAAVYAVRRWRSPHDYSIDWDVGGDIV